MRFGYNFAGNQNIKIVNETYEIKVPNSGRSQARLEENPRTMEEKPSENSKTMSRSLVKRLEENSGKAEER